MNHEPSEPARGTPQQDGASDAVLLSRVYEELRRLAQSHLQRERVGHTLQPTALVNEAYLRLVHADLAGLGRTRFLAYASKAMRHVLVDHSRRRSAGKRGGGEWQRVTLQDSIGPSQDGELDPVVLSELLEVLEQKDSRLSQVVEMRVFGGLSFEEIARTLNLSTRTIERDWYFARGWLAKQLSDQDPQ